MNRKSKPPIEVGDLLDLIRARDKVVILVKAVNPDVPDTRVTGHAVMRGPAGWVLNCGGRHGTPHLADESNIVSVPRLKYGRAKPGDKVRA